MRDRTRTVLTTCGVLSSIVYVAADVVGAMRWPDYDPFSQAISELSAIGAPSRATWVLFGIAYDVLLVAFAVGVRSVARTRRLRVAAAMLFAIAAIGSVWPPMHLRGNVTTLTDTLHVVWASVISLLILGTIALSATALGPRFRIYSRLTIAALLTFGAATFAYAPRLAANLPTPGMGLVERLNLASYLAWVVVFAVGLLRATRPGAREASPPQSARLFATSTSAR